MKTNKAILSVIMIMMTICSACTSNDEIFQVAEPTETAGCVRFCLSGAAHNPVSRATAESNESYIETLHAVLCEQEDNSKVYVYEAKRTGNTDSNGDDEWSFNVEKDGFYQVRFFANLDESTVNEIKELKGDPGFNGNQGDNLSFVDVLRSAVMKKAPDSDTFTMYSDLCSFVTTSMAAGAQDLGTITLSRHSARFDIVNNAEGITIKKITYNNRTKYTNVSPLGKWASEDDWYEDKVYDNLSIAGSKDESATDNKLLHTIYSYHNFTTGQDDGKIPSLTIEYEEKQNDGTSLSRKHTVEFRDKDSGKLLAIKSNTLYTVTLKKGYKLEFDVAVIDWEDAGELNAGELRVNDFDIDPAEQDRLNGLLEVNRFAHFWTKTLNEKTRQVELFTEMVLDRNDYVLGVNGTFHMRSSLNNNNLFDKGDGSGMNILTTTDGSETYKIPTAGELFLLMPSMPEHTVSGYKLDQYMSEDGTIKVRSTGMQMARTLSTNAASPIHWYNNYAVDYKEQISLKNKIIDKLPRMMPVEEDEDALISDIHIRYGKHTFAYYYNSNNILGPASLQADEGMDKRIMARPAYAVRFKGTQQYAAYKWDICMKDNDPNKMYLSIKIKAIPEGVDIITEDITDNDAYWNDNHCIEYALPCAGGTNDKLDTFELSNRVIGLIPGTFSIIDQSCVSWYYNGVYGFMRNSVSSYGMPVLLIKAQSPTGETSAK